MMFLRFFTIFVVAAYVAADQDYQEISGDLIQPYASEIILYRMADAPAQSRRFDMSLKLPSSDVILKAANGLFKTATGALHMVNLNRLASLLAKTATKAAAKPEFAEAVVAGKNVALNALQRALDQAPALIADGLKH